MSEFSQPASQPGLIALLPGEMYKLRQHLIDQAEDVATALLGRLIVRTRRETRFGSNNGSLSVVTADHKRGRWNDRASGKGGDLLGFVRFVGNLNFSEVVDQACALLAAEGVTGTTNVIRTERPDMLQANHTRPDVQLVDEALCQPLGRLWLTLVIDLGSRCVLGFTVSLRTPSTADGGLNGPIALCGIFQTSKAMKHLEQVAGAEKRRSVRVSVRDIEG